MNSDKLSLWAIVQLSYQCFVLQNIFFKNRLWERLVVMPIQIHSLKKSEKKHSLHCIFNISSELGVAK